jgi:hypothetical protein
MTAKTSAWATAVTLAQKDALRAAISASGLPPNVAAREAMRLFCAAQGVEFPVWHNPRKRQSVWDKKKEEGE